MADTEAAPSPKTFSSVFRAYEVRRDGDRVHYFGTPLRSRRDVLDAVEPVFERRGYDVRFDERPGELVLVAEPATTSSDSFPWTNLLLFLATLFSTLYFGAIWYHQAVETPADLLAGAPFSAAVLFVLACHEFGHYFASKYHRVDVTLPYFIPAPTFIGTMGAVIRIKSRMPDRKALFDIGVSGPLVGLVATVIVSAIGLSMDPIRVPAALLQAENAVQIELGWPPLLRAIAWVLGEPLAYADPALSVNPVVIGGWLGMFLTLLNLIPVGQLDGGHILRALIGPQQERIAVLVPPALFGLAGYLHFVADVPTGAGVWGFWGVLTAVFAYIGAAAPADETPLGAKRKALGVLTLVLGLLCFTPVPIQVFA